MNRHRPIPPIYQYITRPATAGDVLMAVVFGFAIGVILFA